MLLTLLPRRSNLHGAPLLLLRILLLVLPLSVATVARGFSFLSYASPEWASRWSVETGVSDGIQVRVDAGFASSFTSDPFEQVLIEYAVEEAFAAWESRVLQFDISFGGPSGGEIELIAVPNSDYHFINNNYFGSTDVFDYFSSPRTLTNGQSVPGYAIYGAQIYINIDNVLGLAATFSLTQAEKLAALQRLVMHETGHALGLGHPNDNNPFLGQAGEPFAFFDTDTDPLNLMLIDGSDPFSDLYEFTIGAPGTHTDNQAIMSNRPCGEPFVAPCPALYFTSLRNDDRGGRDVLYPRTSVFVGGGGPAASGSLGFYVDTSTGFNSGTLVWDDASFDVLGSTGVNLGTSVGSMDVTGTTAGSGFSSSQSSTTPGLLDITITGDFLCPGSPLACPEDNIPTHFVGLADSVTGSIVGVGPGLLPPLAVAAYAEDAYLTCLFGDQFVNCAGDVALNAVARVQMPEDVDPVTVSSVGTSLSPVTLLEEPYAIEVTFDAVTAAGDTTIVPLSAATGNLPANFAVESGDFSALFFKVSTDAFYQSPITVCASYPDAAPSDGIVDGTEVGGPGVDECSMRVLHEEGGTFQDRTITVNATSCPAILAGDRCPLDAGLGDQPCIDRNLNRVCGEVTSLSSFVTAIAVVPAVPASSAWSRVLIAILLMAAASCAISRRSPGLRTRGPVRGAG